MRLASLGAVNVDYVLVPGTVWDLLFGWYGGGPALERPLLTKNSPPSRAVVEINPWVIEVFLCDRQQPYRRNFLGAMSRHVMVLPTTPAIGFFHLCAGKLGEGGGVNVNENDNDNESESESESENVKKARLWKFEDTSGADFGPWELLEKGCLSYSSSTTRPLTDDTPETPYVPINAS